MIALHFRWRGFVIRAICSVVIHAIYSVVIRTINPVEVLSCMFGPDYKSAPARDKHINLSNLPYAVRPAP